MNRLSRPLALSASALLLTTSLAGCGGGSSTSAASPQKWTSALCGALSVLQQDQTSLQTEVAAKAKELGTNPAGVRDIFASAIEKLRGDFAAASTALKKAGEPDVSNGAKIQKDILAALDTAEKLFSDAKDTVAAAKPDAKSISTVFLAVGTKLSDGGKGLSNAFDKIDSEDKSGKLTKAGDANKDCKKLKG